MAREVGLARVGRNPEPSPLPSEPKGLNENGYPEGCSENGPPEARQYLQPWNPETES